MKSSSLSKKEVLKKVWNYMKSYRIWVFLSAFLALLVVAMTLYLPILVGKSIDLIVASGNVDFLTLKRILWEIAFLAIVTSLLQWTKPSAATPPGTLPWFRLR